MTRYASRSSGRYTTAAAAISALQPGTSGNRRADDSATTVTACTPHSAMTKDTCDSRSRGRNPLADSSARGARVTAPQYKGRKADPAQQGHDLPHGPQKPRKGMARGT